MGVEQFKPIQFTIRHATGADIGAMSLVLERATAHRDGKPLPDTVADETSRRDVESHRAEPGAWAYVAEHRDGLAGFVAGHEPYLLDMDDRAEHLALLMCEPDCWGAGVGRALLNKAAETARAKGKQRVLLWTAISNARAIALYKHTGYRRTTVEQRISPRQGPLDRYTLDLG